MIRILTRLLAGGTALIVPALAGAAGLAEVTRARDLAGICRCLVLGPAGDGSADLPQGE